ncbi:glycosyltransferase family 4 protein, partial [Thermodesulfobacteriota bacterium]
PARPCRNRTMPHLLNVTNKLNDFIQPENGALVAIRTQLTDIINILHDSTNLTIVQHKQVIDKQEEAFYHSWFGLIYSDFHKVLEQLAGNSYREVLSFSHLLFMEISRSYLISGEIWQLGYEINLFKTLPPSQQQSKSYVTDNKPGRMKILVVSAMFPSIEHGGGNRLFDIISELSAEHEVALFSAYMPEADKYSMELLKHNVCEMNLVDEESLNHQTILEWLSDLNRKHGHYHVIQCEYPNSVALIDTLRPFGLKVGFTYMECVTKSYLIRLQNSIRETDFVNIGQLARSFWEFAVEELEAALKTDFQIAVTPEDADFIELASGIRPDIIPTCLSQSQVIDRFEKCKNIEPQGNTVVFLGYFNHFPNIDGVKWYVRNIHQEVKNKVPDYRFLVVGAGDTNELKKLTSEDDSVVYTGRVDDIAPEIMRGKVCVLPLISGAGIRGKLNQYSLANRPSVSTTIGNTGLEYEDGETVLIADTPEDFAEAVVKLLTDNNLNRNMANKAKSHAEENFTWDSHIERLKEIYRS